MRESRRRRTPSTWFWRRDPPPPGKISFDYYYLFLFLCFLKRKQTKWDDSVELIPVVFFVFRFVGMCVCEWESFFFKRKESDCASECDVFLEWNSELRRGRPIRKITASIARTSILYSLIFIASLHLVVIDRSNAFLFPNFFYKKNFDFPRQTKTRLLFCDTLIGGFSFFGYSRHWFLDPGVLCKKNEFVKMTTATDRRFWNVHHSLTKQQICSRSSSWHNSTGLDMESHIHTYIHPTNHPLVPLHTHTNWNRRAGCVSNRKYFVF